MGCSGSKLEDLEAVALCRGRTDHLADAIRHRYALADSHAAYSASLRSVAASLHRFLDSAAGSLSSSPLLSLPTHRKGDPLPPPSSPPPAAAVAASSSAAAAAAAHSHSHSSGSGSHIQFHSSDDEDDSGSVSADSDDHFNPHHHLDYNDYYRAGTLDGGGGGGGPTSFMNFNYARSQPPPPSVSFEHRPEVPQPVHFSDPSPSSSSSSYPNYNYPNYSNYSYPYDYQSNNYYGFFAGSSSAPPPPPNLPPSARPASSAPKPAPPPPSPPRTSTWDFLNPFEGQDSYYQSYTPSRSSREVRDEEGIPELEEEENEVVKEVYGDQKFAASTSREYHGSDEEGIGDVDDDSKIKGRRSVEVENEEDVVEKKVVIDEVQQRPQQNVGSSSNPRKYHDISEIGSEIRIQFERASDAVAELSKMLEVGKHPYHYRKSSVMEGEGSNIPSLFT